MDLKEELIPIFKACIDSVPDSLRQTVETRTESLLELASHFPIECQKNETIADLIKVMVCSEFVTHNILRDSNLLPDLLHSGDINRTYGPTTHHERLSKLLSVQADQTGLEKALRHYRQREMVRIAWRDITGAADMQNTVMDLSTLADVCISNSLSLLQSWLQPSLGRPREVEGKAQTLVVLAMGKLGAQELNFSSDVDLIFCYPAPGETYGGARSVHHDEFFTQLGRQLIAVLANSTADGFVFRVDMRLRPFGSSGPLVMRFDAIEHYYQAHGREWERYAMVKARAITGEQWAIDALHDVLRPFVYRRYHDYGSFSSLREMKLRIKRETGRTGMENNIKLGQGGIREVEFIGQAFQLIHGGREPALQVRQIQTVLERLGDFDLLPDYVINELSEAYVFLRNTEHRLQEVADQQTHQLPSEPKDQHRLAYAMGFDSWPTYLKVLKKHRDHVHNHFQQIITAPQLDQADLGDDGIRKIWDQSLPESLAIEILAEFGYDVPEQAYEIVKNAYQIRSFRVLSQQGRRRLDHLMPLLIGAVGKSFEPTRTLKRLLILLEAIAQRTSYLALLAEYPLALSQLVKLCAASPWISHLLARQPILLDELLDPRTLYVAATRDQLIAQLQSRLANVKPNDLEQQMNELRNFKNSNVLRVASVDILDLLPLMRVSDHLTEIAEVVLQSVLNMAWLHMRERHGLPFGLEGKGLEGKGLQDKGLEKKGLDSGLEEKGLAKDGAQMGFAIIAYGKLGGIELGYGSDLDLVFLYQGDSNAMTDGDKPLANAVFYARLGQRIIHLLQTLTPAGVLYDVDLRLRPSGASGLLVASVEGFEDYQMKRAWIWEHQALVRARPVAGDEQIKQRFTQIRRRVLSQPRDVKVLREEICGMRERMRKELSLQDKSQHTAQLSPQEGDIDIKQGQGGIVDIEFMVQYIVLANATTNPDLMTYTDVVRILEACVDKRLMAPDVSTQLSDIYKEYRSCVHHLTLQEKSALIDASKVEDQRKIVIKQWQSLMFT